MRNRFFRNNKKFRKFSKLLRKKNINVIKIIGLIIILLNFPHIVQIKADFNYSLESRFVHGEYNNNGTNKDLLNHPSDIFLGNTDLIISDTDNNRIVVLNRTNWDLLNIIYPYSKDINNNLVNVSSIY